MQLVSAFVFAYAKNRFSHDVAQNKHAHDKTSYINDCFHNADPPGHLHILCCVFRREVLKTQYFYLTAVHYHHKMTTITLYVSDNKGNVIYVVCQDTGRLTSETD